MSNNGNFYTGDNNAGDNHQMNSPLNSYNDSTQDTNGSSAADNSQSYDSPQPINNMPYDNQNYGVQNYGAQNPNYYANGGYPQARGGFSPWITALVTFFFGLFGLIPAYLGNKADTEIGNRSNRHWKTFGFTILTVIIVNVILLVMMFAVMAANNV